MPKYKLTYFNIRARAEPIRWLFAQAGVEYEDIRLDRENVWPSVKPNMPFCQVPILDVDGQILAQSQTIGRYLANQFGLAGKEDWEKALVDQYVDGIYDILAGIRTFFREPDEERKTTLRKKFLEETVPKVVSRFEKVLESSTSGYLVGDSLTWADVYLAAYLDDIPARVAGFDDLLKKYPSITAHMTKIRSLPKIAAWIKSRPG